MPYATLSEHVLRSRSGHFERKVWMSPAAPETAEAAVVFLDAELYVERVDAPAVVRRLREGRDIPPVATAFVSQGGAAARHEDYVCQPRYAEFIAADVVAWMRNEHPSMRDVVIAGLSLSGLAAAYVATQHPGVFRAAICQSPSFWWDGGRFGTGLPAATAERPEFWVCVGNRETDSRVSHPPSGLRQEMTQIEGCDAACQALRVRGYDIAYRRYEGGHDPTCWREDLALALPWVWRNGSSGRDGER